MVGIAAEIKVSRFNKKLHQRVEATQFKKSGEKNSPLKNGDRGAVEGSVVFLIYY